MARRTIEIIVFNEFKVDLPIMALQDDYSFTMMNQMIIVLVTNAWPKVMCNFTYPIGVMWGPEKPKRSL